MRILVCFKVISEVDHLNQNELKRLSQGEDVLRFSKRIYSPYDEGALETALVIKATSISNDQKDHLTALTIGDCDSRFLKELYAIRFDEVIQITTEKDCSFSPQTTAQILIDHLEVTQAYDAIFMGMQAGVGESALVPSLVAQALDLHLVSDVIDVKKEGIDLLINSQTDTGKLTMIVKTPILCAFGNAAHPYLRVATLKEKILSKEKSANVLSVKTNTETSSLKLERLHYRPLERQGIFPDDGLKVLIEAVTKEIQ